ncbi:hypothetical protein [Parapedobacter sp. 2B3]|uniref:hypothetical protein n=1 Tax=Parapedobacter sp. 2B3 TaxID=3342381 RepID=UPI0035B5AD42
MKSLVLVLSLFVLAGGMVYGEKITSTKLVYDANHYSPDEEEECIPCDENTGETGCLPASDQNASTIPCECEADGQPVDATTGPLEALSCEQLFRPKNAVN